MPERSPAAKRRWLRFACFLIAYAALLAASQFTQRLGPEEVLPPLEEGTLAIDVPMMDDAGAIPGVWRSQRLAYLAWPAVEADKDAEAGGPAGPRAPVILLHGSPGDKENWLELAPLIAAGGRDVYALDMPGFGESAPAPPTYSMRSQAHATLAFMSAMKIERAHLVGWSNGGGAVLHMADIDDSRAASLTLLAAIGLQETEGTGDYHFEHAKYALGIAVFAWLPEAIPHFGALGDVPSRQAWIRAFYDSDQRPLEGIMARLRVPTLVIHGRRDPLVPHWAAERHYEAIPTARLTMLDAMHFLPWTEAEETTEHLAAFFARHDPAGVPALRDVVDEAPVEPLLGEASETVSKFLIDAPWWLVLALVVLAAMRSEHATIAVLALLGPVNLVDFLVAYLALLAARGARAVYTGARMERRLPELAAATRRDLGRRPLRSALALPFQPWRIGEAGSPGRLLLALGPAAPVLLVMHVLRIVLLTTVAMAVATPIAEPPMYGLGLFIVLVAMAAAYVATPTAECLLTWTGRRRLLAQLARIVHHEHWPSFVFYAPIAPYLLWLALKHRHPLAFTALNSGIGNGGGVVGESKADIMARLTPITPAAAATALIPAGATPPERAARAIALTNEDAAFALPVIVKPDAGQRGFSVRLIRNQADFEPYFAEMTRDAIVQQYAPGPEEIGLMWCRTPKPNQSRARQEAANVPKRPNIHEHQHLPAPAHLPPPTNTATPTHPHTDGVIFSITRKVFPILEADGQHTIEHQIYAHPRYRRQADRFLARLGPRRYDTPPAGERLRLAEAGNHCQGTMFLDGADLITPALSNAIDKIARAYPGPDNKPGGLDIGRFDLRFNDYEQLKAGRNFTIVELNGATSESTNIYDPRGTLPWAYGYLFRQWRLMYTLGADRIAEGARPMSIRDLLATLSTFYRARPGSELSD